MAINIDTICYFSPYENGTRFCFGGDGEHKILLVVKETYEEVISKLGTAEKFV